MKRNYRDVGWRNPCGRGKESEMRTYIRKLRYALVLCMAAFMVILFSGVTARAASITPSQVKGTWDGEYDGDWKDSAGNTIYVKRHVTLVFTSCDSSGNVKGGLYLAAMPGKEYQFTGSYNFSGKVNLSTGYMTINPGSWIKSISNFNKSNFRGTFQISSKLFSGYRYIGSNNKNSTKYKIQVKKVSNTVAVNKLYYISLSATSQTLNVGNSVTLKYSVSPNTITPSSVKWTTSNKNVCTVTSKGKVTAVKAGTATITCTASYNGSSVSAKCTVKVNAPVTKYKLTCTVRDAANGAILSGAGVRIRSGSNNKTGTVVATTTTNKKGVFTATLNKGNYTIDLSKKNYVQYFFNVSLTGNKTVSAAMTKAIASTKYRVVLSWGSKPADVDLHVTGPISGSSRFHTYWYSKSYYSNGVYRAQLDVDDCSSYGPETITLDLSKGKSGTYHFYVHDYTNRNLSSTNALAKSGARIDVYNGSKRLASYTVPNIYGTVWQVFDLVNGQIKTVNKMSYNSNLLTQ